MTKAKGYDVNAAHHAGSKGWDTRRRKRYEYWKVPEADRPFLEAVCDRPDDGLPRSIYADWLCERRANVRSAFWRWMGGGVNGQGRIMVPCFHAFSQGTRYYSPTPEKANKRFCFWFGPADGWPPNVRDIMLNPNDRRDWKAAARRAIVLIPGVPNSHGLWGTLEFRHRDLGIGTHNDRLHRWLGTDSRVWAVRFASPLDAFMMLCHAWVEVQAWEVLTVEDTGYPPDAFEPSETTKE